MASFVWWVFELVLLFEVELCAALAEMGIALLEFLVVRFASEDFGGFDFLGDDFGANGSV